MADMFWLEYGGCATGIVIVLVVFLVFFGNKFFAGMGQGTRRPEHETLRPAEVLHEDVNPATIALLQDKQGRIRTVTSGDIINLTERKAVLYDEQGSELLLHDYSKLKPIDSFFAFFRNEDVIWRIEDDSYIDNIKDENFRLKMQLKALKSDLKATVETTKETMRTVGEIDRTHRQAKYGRSGGFGGGSGMYTPMWRRGGYGGGGYGGGEEEMME